MLKSASQYFQRTRRRLQTPRAMLKKQRSLKWDFAAYIVALTLLCLVLPIFLKESWCEIPRQNQGAINSNPGPTRHQYSTYNVSCAIAAQQQETNNEKQAPTERNFTYLRRSGLCEETKLSDLVLVFFTGCLVIVGWFTIRNGERVTRDQERPYIFGTPQIDTEKTKPIGSKFVEIILHNYGRTPGTVEVIYGEASLNEPFGSPVYKNGSRRTAGGMLPPTLGKPMRAPATFECPVATDFYFFGYVDYVDLFGGKHTSRFCAKLFIDQRGIEAAGPEAFHDWN